MQQDQGPTLATPAMASPAAQSSSEQQQTLSPDADGQQNQIPPPPPVVDDMAHYALVPGWGQPALYQADGNIPGRQARGRKADIGRQGKGEKATHTDAFHGPVNEAQSGPQLEGEFLTREHAHTAEMHAALLEKADVEGRFSQEGVILDHPGVPQRIALTPRCVETLSEPVKRVGEEPDSPFAPYYANVSWGYSEAMLDNRRCAADRFALEGLGAGHDAAQADRTHQLGKVDAAVWVGLQRLADRLGYVFAYREEAKIPNAPNVTALLKALGNGDAFKQGTVLHKSILGDTELGTGAEQVITLLQSNLKLIELILEGGFFGCDFSKMYEHVIVHAHGLRANKGHNDSVVKQNQQMWPKWIDHNVKKQKLPAGSIFLPPHIDLVRPADLQETVASLIRQNMTAVTLDFLRLLCRAYGYRTVSASGFKALCWQLGNRRARSVPLSGTNFVNELLQHSQTGPIALKAALAAKQVKVKQAFFRKHMPQTRHEVMMMASTNTTYR